MFWGWLKIHFKRHLYIYSFLISWPALFFIIDKFIAPNDSTFSDPIESAFVVFFLLFPLIIFFLWSYKKISKEKKQLGNKSWLKGILSSILVFVGILFIVYGFYLFGEDNSIGVINNLEIGGAISLVIGLIMSVVGSYLKYVSKQTVKPTKNYNTSLKFLLFFFSLSFIFFIFLG